MKRSSRLSGLLKEKKKPSNLTVSCSKVVLKNEKLIAEDTVTTQYETTEKGTKITEIETIKNTYHSWPQGMLPLKEIILQALREI